MGTFLTPILAVLWSPLRTGTPRQRRQLATSRRPVGGVPGSQSHDPPLPCGWLSDMGVPYPNEGME